MNWNWKHFLRTITYPIPILVLSLVCFFAKELSAWAISLADKQFASFVQDGALLSADPIANKYLYLLGGSDGTNYHVIKTDSTGAIGFSGWPAASALADSEANPTTTRVGANLMGYDNASGTWSRLRTAFGGKKALAVSICDPIDVTTNCLTPNPWISSNSESVSESQQSLLTFSFMGGAETGIAGVPSAKPIGAVKSDSWQAAAMPYNVDGTNAALWTAALNVASGYDSGNLSVVYSFSPDLDALNTTGLTDHALGAVSFNRIYNGTTWDRMRGDAAFNTMVSLGTQLDGVNDTVSIRIANVIPTMPTAGADAVSNTFNGLVTNSFGSVFNGTTWDRWYGYAANADTITSPTKGLGGVASYLLAYNGTTWDRARLDGAAGNLLVKSRVVDGSILTGYSQPGTNIEITGSTVKYCTSSNALTVGVYYEVQTDGRTHCAMVADNSGSVATTDEPYDSPGIYHRYVIDTSHDTLCCITTAATVLVDLTPQTLVAQ